MKNLSLAASALLVALNTSSAQAENAPPPSVKLPSDCGESALDLIVPVANAYLKQYPRFVVKAQDIIFRDLEAEGCTTNPVNDHEQCDYSANYRGKATDSDGGTTTFSGKIQMTTTRGGCFVHGFEFTNMEK